MPNTNHLHHVSRRLIALGPVEATAVARNLSTPE